MQPSQQQDTAPVFAALGDERRLHLVARLGNEGPLSLTELVADAGITRQAVAKHLRVLEEAGLVSGGKSGRDRVWMLEPARLASARAHLEELSAHWDRALERLRRFVEE